MKKALVLGASGSMGYSIVNELTGRGVSVVAFARNNKRLEALFKDNNLVTLYPGDIFNKEQLMKAAEDVDIIFHAVNIPYSQWETRLYKLVEHIVETAKAHSVKLAVVDNIYAYGRKPNELVTEESPKNPHTKKGRIRLQIEQLIQHSNVPAFIAHFPDFYGPNATSTLLDYTFQQVALNKSSRYIGNQKIAREFIYTPDGAKAIVELASNEKAYGQSWNIPGYSTITGEEIVKILRTTMNYQKNVSTVSKGMIRLLGIFNKDMREVVEMFYLNEQPVVLSGKKYESIIGELPRTSYQEGIIQTLEFMKRK